MRQKVQCENAGLRSMLIIMIISVLKREKSVYLKSIEVGIIFVQDG